MAATHDTVPLVAARISRYLSPAHLQRHGAPISSTDLDRIAVVGQRTTKVAH